MTALLTPRQVAARQKGGGMNHLPTMDPEILDTVAFQRQAQAAYAARRREHRADYLRLKDDDQTGQTELFADPVAANAA